MLKSEKKGKFILHTFQNENIIVKTMNYGATLLELHTKNRNGEFENIVLTNNNLEDYERQENSFFSQSVGRTCNRIKEGKFTINNQMYQSTINEFPNQLHGGSEGFSFQFFMFEEVEREDGFGIKYYRLSPNGEEGYPGNLNVEIYYLIKNNELLIEYKAKSDKDTIVNLTNHSYFNLSGNYKETIENHSLKIEAKKYLELDNENIPTGKILNVANTPLDFRVEKLIGKDIEHPTLQLSQTKGIDHCFLLDGQKEIVLKDKKSGRKLEVKTTYPALQVYTTNYPTYQKLSNNKNVKKYQGICLECQYEPDAINHEHFSNIILKKNEVYNHSIKLNFSSF